MKKISVLLLFLMSTSPLFSGAIPEEAEKHLAWGAAALEDAKDNDGFKKAAEEFEAAAKLAPKWPVPYYNLGIVYSKLEDLDDATKNFKKYLKLSPNAQDSKTIKTEIYKLEYKKKQADDKDVKDALAKKWGEMVLIPAGEFTMGSPDGEGIQDVHPQHKVWLNAFYIDKYPVTFDQYDKFCDDTGASKPDDHGWGRGTRPVINVDWDAANAYAKWAGKRLPTEAEYEKALRGGTATKYFWGDDDDQAGEYAWYRDNSADMIHPVGGKKPNPYGLYDILGNVHEWCSDWYGDGYFTVSPVKNPQGPDSGKLRVLRGGSFGDLSGNIRSSHRWPEDPGFINCGCGFRCARTP